MNLEEALAHAGRQDMDEIERRAREALPHYMFTDGDARHRTGYCTCCQQTRIPLRQDASVPDWVMTDPYVDEELSGLHHPEHAFGFRGPWTEHGKRGEKNTFTNSGKHLDYGTCPVCGNVVQYRSFHMGRKTLRDRILLIRYKKSAVEERALVMVGYLVICDWGAWDDYNEWLPELYIDLREICVFRPGQGGQRFTKRVGVEPDWDAAANPEGWIPGRKYAYWTKNKKCIGGFDPWQGPYRFSNTRFLLDEDTVRDALDGTPWTGLYEKHADEGLLDRIDFFHKATKYPCVEYLEKLGYHDIAGRIVSGGMDLRLLNLRGKTAPAVLRVDGNFYGWLKGNKIDASPTLLEMYHVLQATGWKLGNDALLWLSQRTDADGLTRLGEPLPGGLLKKAVRYMMKHRVAPWEYRDHLLTMRNLHMDMQDEQMLFPRSFRETHDALAERVKVLASAEKNAKVAKRAAKLDGWQFSALGLTIRPMLTADEIIREGNEMRHCVGTYVDRYMAGGTVLLALREDERLDKPWRTVEYTTGGKLVQCRGYRNQCPEDEQERIDRFFALFDRFRAEYKSVRVKEETRGKAA